jgi:hypothetical protein
MCQLEDSWRSADLLKGLETTREKQDISLFTKCFSYIKLYVHVHTIYLCTFECSLQYMHKQKIAYKLDSKTIYAKIGEGRARCNYFLHNK